jgi:choice-of-anchor C domain-containing protein
VLAKDLPMPGRCRGASPDHAPCIPPEEASAAARPSLTRYLAVREISGLTDSVSPAAATLGVREGNAFGIGGEVSFVTRGVFLVRALSTSAMTVCAAASVLLGASLISPIGARADRAVAVNLVSNGGFETPHIVRTAMWDTISLGSRMGAWKVGAGSVDLIDTHYWKPAAGKQSLDLNGNEAGTIYQDIKTRPGARYRLTFSLTTNVDGAPAMKEFRVSFGATSAVFHKAQTTTSRADIRWQTVSRVFVATKPITRLSFASLTPTAYGAVIDNVTVTRT